MTREQRVNKLALAGVPKFARAGTTPKSDLKSGVDGKQLPPPQTSDSGFSEVPNKSQQDVAANDGDYGVASVIHVIEPDISGTRHWWHTKGFKSDPYTNGTLPLPSVRESKAASEAKEAARKIAQARNQIKQAQNTTLASDTNNTSDVPRARTGNAPDAAFAPPLQGVPKKVIGVEDSITTSQIPGNSSRGEAFTGKVAKTYTNSALASVNLNRLNSSNNTRPDQNNINKQGNARGNGKDLGDLKITKASVKGKPPVGGKDRTTDRKSLSSISEIEDENKPFGVFAKRIQGSKSISARKGTLLTNASRENQDVHKAHLPESGSIQVSQNLTQTGDGAVRRLPRPSTASICERTHFQGHDPQRHHFHTSVEKHNKKIIPHRSRTPPKSSASPARHLLRRSRSISPAPVSGRSPTPDNARKRHYRHGRFAKGHSFKSLPVKERGRSALKKKVPFQDSLLEERAKSPRRVCFVTDNDGKSGARMERKPAISYSVKKKKRSKTVKIQGKPTQRTIDNEAILDVAQANKIESNVKKISDDENRGVVKDIIAESSDSEGEHEGKSKLVPKNAWEVFEEQVKSIDDGTITFSPQDLSSNSSDLFEKVMWEVGPQFRKPTKSEDPESDEGETVEELSEKAVTTLPKRTPSMQNRNKSRRGWNMLKKTMMDIKLDKGKRHEASLNWKFLCTTINNTTDMEKGREALYQKYIYDPNSWMKGFTTPPAAVLKQGHRSKFNESLNLRNVQSTNGHRTVVVGHQGPHDLPHKSTRSKTRVNSTPGGIKVAPMKSNNDASAQLSK